jgi:hypothetical protein
VLPILCGVCAELRYYAGSGAHPAGDTPAPNMPLHNMGPSCITPAWRSIRGHVGPRLAGAAAPAAPAVRQPSSTRSPNVAGIRVFRARRAVLGGLCI